MQTVLTENIVGIFVKSNLVQKKLFDNYLMVIKNFLFVQEMLKVERNLIFHVDVLKKNIMFLFQLT